VSFTYKGATHCISPCIDGSLADPYKMWRVWRCPHVSSMETYKSLLQKSQQNQRISRDTCKDALMFIRWETMLLIEKSNWKLSLLPDVLTYNRCEIMLFVEKFKWKLSSQPGSALPGLFVVSEKTVLRFVDSAGTQNAFCRITNEFTLLFAGVANSLFCRLSSLL